MKKQYLILLFLLSSIASFGQELIQEAFVKKAYIAVEGEWQETTFKTPIEIFSNREGYLKIKGAEFLIQLSANKAKMLENSAYNTAELTSQVLSKSKTEKNGLTNTTYEGKLVFKTMDGVYTPNVAVVFTINQADVVRLKITNYKNNQEFIVDLEIK